METKNKGPGPKNKSQRLLIKPKRDAQTVYSIRNGTIEPIKLQDFSDFKQAELDRLEYSRLPKGFHKIKISDTLQNKVDNPQTKLWYYDKSQYVNQESKNTFLLLILLK